jgi:hypothetical protein
VSERTPRPGDEPDARPAAVAAGQAAPDEAPTEIRETPAVEPSPAGGASAGSAAAGAGSAGASAGTAPAGDTPSHDELEARAAQTREEVRVADARRAEETTAQAEKAAEAARRAEREARERAQRASEDAERARAEAGLRPGGTVSGASVTAPGVGSTTEPRTVAEATSGSRAAVAANGGDAASTTDERPELLVGGAFVGAFLVGRLLKRILD